MTRFLMASLTAILVLVSGSLVACEGTPAMTADFVANLTSGEVPLTVQFTDLSTGDITAWNWDFGDGHTSELQSPSHTYTSIGMYTVSLMVSGTYTRTKVNYIEVVAPPGYEGTPCEVLPTLSELPSGWKWLTINGDRPHDINRGTSDGMSWSTCTEYLTGPQYMLFLLKVLVADSGFEAAVLMSQMFEPDLQIVRENFIGDESKDYQEDEQRHLILWRRTNIVAFVRVQDCPSVFDASESMTYLEQLVTLVDSKLRDGLEKAGVR